MPPGWFTEKQVLKNVRTILSRYLIKEMIPPFGINVGFFLFVFLMTKLLEITDYIVNYNVGLLPVLRMLIYTMPFFLQFVIPMAVMMAVLLTFLRMSGDNETIAIKACGVSLYRLLVPVLVFCMMGCVATAAMTIYGIPWGSSQLKALTLELASSSLDVGVKPRTFNTSFEGVVFYVNQADPQKKSMEDIFIEDQRHPDTVTTIVAPKGILFQNSEKLTAHLRLFNGTLVQVDLKEHSTSSLTFDTYDLNLNLSQMTDDDADSSKNRLEMSIPEMRRYLANYGKPDSLYYRTLMDYYKKFSVPIACFALGLIAVPLGFQSVSARRSFGIGLGLIFFLSYYLLLSAGWAFGKNGTYPPIIGMWLPNVLFGLSGLYLLYRAAADRHLALGAIFWKLVGWLPRSMRPLLARETDQTH